MNPGNLALRFLLELAAFAGFSKLVWASTAGYVRIPAVVAVLCALAAIWGVFNVPGDPSRSGAAPVPVPGTVRLMLELCILLGGALAFYLADQRLVAGVMAALIVVHYGLSADRIRWLLQQER